MKVEIHKLFAYLLETTEVEPEAMIGHSLSPPPVLGDYLSELDRNLPLDWNNRSFLGLPPLREHILRQAGLAGELEIDDVLVTAGAAEANFLAITQLLQPGDELVTEQPGWPQAEVLAHAKGCEVKKIRRSEANGWALPIDALEDAVGPRTRIIFLTNPNNPSGHVLTGEELEVIGSIADRVGAWLIVDEVYAGLEWACDRAPCVAQLHPRGIATGSVSKTLGLQGLRTGWMICQDDRLIRDAYILRENTSEIMNIMGEHISEIALRPNRYAKSIEKARKLGRKNLDKLDDFISGQSLLDWQRPMAGLIGLARLQLEIGGDAFAEQLLAPPYRTFLIPGSAYGEPEHIRVGVGGGDAVNLDKGLDRLGALLAEFNR